MQTVDHTKTILSVEKVSFSYNGAQVLDDVSLVVHRGDYIALVGGNGSGKTTLIRIILGLLKPASGSVRLFGKRLQDFTEWSKIGYVPQKATAFDVNFPATVEEVVLMGRYGRRGLFHGITDEDRRQVDAALEQVGIVELRDKLAGDLSGGQQQRVFIARALAGEPEIIILDEPTVGVEKTVKDDFYALLRKLNEELHLTVILVTHDIETIAHEAMHIACIDRTLFFHNSVEEFLKSEETAHSHGHAGALSHIHD